MKNEGMKNEGMKNEGISGIEIGLQKKQTKIRPSPTDNSFQCLVNFSFGEDRRKFG